ncbi:MAG: hypothetical protein ABJ239_07430 [Erythrobacter sp.]
MELGLKALLKLLPLIFGIGFLAPVIAAAMVALDLSGPFGLAPLQVGFVIGGSWGLIATITGRWI